MLTEINHYFVGVPGRILVFSVCICGAIVFWGYNAGLVSMLTVDHIVFPIKTMEDLAGSSKYKLILEEGTAYVDFFESAPKNSSRYEIWSKLDEKTQLINTSKESELGIYSDPIEKIMIEDGDYVYFGPKLGTQAIFKSIPCNITTESDDYFTASIAWAFQKNSPYLPLINFNLNKALETGTISRIMRRFINVPDESTCKSSSYKIIDIKIIFTGFLMLLLGIICACIVAIAESKWYHPTKKGKQGLLIHDKWPDITKYPISKRRINVEIGKALQQVLTLCT